MQLAGSFLKLKGVLKFSLPAGVGGKGKALGLLAQGVKAQQLLRHILHRGAHFGLGALPAVAAQAVQLGSGGVAADIFLHQVHLFGGDKQLVAGGIFNFQIIGRHSVGRYPFNASKQADAVVGMHDVIAGF